MYYIRTRKIFKSYTSTFLNDSARRVCSYLNDSAARIYGEFPKDLTCKINIPD